MRRKKSQDMKDIWLDVFDKMGGIKGLLSWAQENQNEFYKICTKLFSINIGEENEEPTQVLVKFLENNKKN